MLVIYILTDYKGYFGSKQLSTPKYGGFDKLYLSNCFRNYGYEIKYLDFGDINFREHNFKNQWVLYTSSEDRDYLYKDYIEDIVLALELQGARLMPPYKLLRANNNKVFMELLRDLTPVNALKTISSSHYGTLENLMKQLHHLNDRMVIKTAKGAMSKGVALSVNKTDLIQKAKKISRSRNWFSELWNFKNTFKYKGFIPDSKYRNKFVIQNFIPGLDSDWKILIYGLKYYALKRNVRKNDFRASGSGLLKFTPEIPNGILDFAKLVYQTIDVPQLSIDVAFDGNDFHLIEFQALYFGSYTLESSPFYYLYNKGWNLINEKSVLESVFADSVVQYIANKNE